MLGYDTVQIGKRNLNRILFAVIVLALALSPLAAGCSGSSSEAGTAEPSPATTPTTQLPTPTEGEEPGETTPPATQTEPQEPTIDSLVIEPASVELQIEGEQAFSATVLDSEGNPMPQAEVTWETADSLGTVNEEGILTAGTKAGTFEEGLTVTATANGRSVTATASVTLKPGTPVSVSIPDIHVPAAETHQLHFTANDEHGNEVTDPEATWTLTEVNAGTLTESGMLTAGEVARAFPDCVTVEIPVGDETLTAGGTVTIVAGALAQVVVAPDPIELGLGMTQQFVAVGADRFGNRISDLQLQWSVENEGGTIDESGLFTAGEEPDTYQDAVKVAAVQGEIEKSATATVTVEPDRIAFVSNRLDDQFDIYIMNTDGTGIERITETETSEEGISWSPDGRRLLYGPWNEDGGISVMNDDGTWELQILQNEGTDAAFTQPSWSPDGNRIAFVKYFPPGDDGKWKSDIYVMDLDGGALTQLTDTPDDTEVFPVWSPDGSRIAYDYTQLGHRADVCVMDSDGTDVDRLTKPLTSSEMTITDTTPSWSPDGEQIAFASNRSGFLSIYVMRNDGFNLNRLSVNMQGHAWGPDWSVDGSKIFYVLDRDYGTAGREDIYVVSADGGSAVQLTEDDASISYIAVAPRRKGLPVSEASIAIPNTSRLSPALDAEQVFADSRGAVVRVQTDREKGSGFIIDPAGLIMTSNRIIVDAEEITVRLDDGTEYEATVRNRDMARDLAVLEIDAEGLPSLELGNARNLELGEEVMALGYPLDSETVNVTNGLVSALDYDKGRDITFVKTDSAVNEGNYGGPLINLHGEVVGVLSSKHIEFGVEGIAYAISANTIRTYLPVLLAEE